jgi:sec-independent protein translocase protein TatB
MFDMGFTEMMLIGIVALVVIGPERLPGVARTAGKYVGRLKRFMTSVKADVEQELRADELRQILADQQKELNSLKDTISAAGNDIERQVDVSDAIAEPVAPAASAVEHSDTTPPVPETTADVPDPPPSTAAEPTTKSSS